MISSIPRSQPPVKFTVTVVDGWVQPVVISCMELVVIACVRVCPKLSVNVSVPATLAVYTRMLISVLGPGEKVNEREVPDAEPK
jgi:hypothetical protein